VNTLVNIGIISSKEDNGKTYYYMDESKMINLRQDTLLGLPLSKNQEDLSKGLYKRFIGKMAKIRHTETIGTKHSCKKCLSNG